MLSFIYSIRKVIVIGIYLLGLIILGEFHPFSRFPMYDSFPNWSYVFYITDADDNLIPCYDLNTNGGSVGHPFYSTIESKGYNYGHGIETNEQLAEVGKEMLDIILTNAGNIELNTDSLLLHRTFYYFENDSIIHEDRVIHSRLVE